MSCLFITVGLPSLSLSCHRLTLRNLVSAPWVFQGIWKLLGPMLDPVVRAKIVSSFAPLSVKYARVDISCFVARNSLNRLKISSYIFPRNISSSSSVVLPVGLGSIPRSFQERTSPWTMLLEEQYVLLVHSCYSHSSCYRPHWLIWRASRKYKLFEMLWLSSTSRLPDNGSNRMILLSRRNVNWLS